MDLYCQHCEEPADVYHVNHDMDPEFRAMFRAGTGCDCCEGKGARVDSLRADAMGAMMDIMGDDLDGCASMMDDFDYMGMLDG